MNWLETRTFRVLSFVVLLFFSWTFGGFFDITYAVKDIKELSASADQPKAEKSEEKFTKALENIEQILTDISTDTDTKKNKLKTKKAKIGNLDKEIKKQFKATEKKLKEAGLPQEIIKRHKDFVKLYKDNLKELNDNLDEIDQAADEFEINEKIEKTKKFLKKVKPPKKHTPLDPNKLPHRTPEPVFKEPRLNKEEFQDSSQLLAVSNQLSEPILIASNGSLSGLLDSDPFNPYPTLKVGLGDSFMLAQADPPTSADLEETIEVQFTPEITAKAEELENNPVKIYNWVRNNIEFVPTYGSIQGADYCLQTEQCNAVDTASLLIALLRVSGIHARYVEGTVEIPIEKVKNWVGGFTDSMEAINLLASAGIPTTGNIIGGELKSAWIEHIWVEAYVDYMPSRGAQHKTGQGDTWISLDASFKQYNYTQGIDIQSAVPFDAQSFIDQITATATINETEGYVTGIDSLYINQTMTDYQTQVESYITANYPDATVGDVLGKKEIVPQEFSYLLGTLPYRTIVKGTEYAEIPSSLRHKISFKVVKDMYDELLGTPLNISKSLPELAGKKITLSYSPATQADEDTINSYLPEPHPDGTPIDPSELPTSLSAYLINVKPEVRVDGEVIATGSSAGLGQKATFTMTFIAPNTSSDVIKNEITAGEYYGIAIDTGRISKEQMEALKTKLEATKAKLEAEDFTGMTKDDILGDLLYTTALSFYAQLDVMDYVQAKTMNVLAIRLPSEAHFSYELSVYSVFGVPMSVSSGGLAMDVDRQYSMVKAFDGDTEKPKQFFLSSGANGSALEHSVPEQLFSTSENPAEGISAVKALKIANEQGIPIYTINQTNINTVLPNLQLDLETITDIQNAVNAGMVATVPQTDITYNGWTGHGYIVIDPNTGAGAYMIAGGMSGAILLITIAVMLLILLIVFAPVIIPAIASVFATVASAVSTLLLKMAVLWQIYLADSIVAWLIAIALACQAITGPPGSPPDENAMQCILIMIIFKALLGVSP